MRGAVIKALEAPPEVTELGDVEGILIEAVALNPLDVSVSRGLFYGGHPPLPYVPGCEAVGRTGEGQVVYLFGGGRGTTSDGFLAERVAVPAELPVQLPDGADPGLAAAAGIAGIAGWVPVAWKAKVGPGDRVLVLGARGAVGQVAVQAAKLLGAETVVGAGRSAEPGIVSYDEVADVFGEEGFTVCIDPIWGEPLAGVLAVAARHARIVHVGQSAGPVAALRSADVRGKELTILGHSNFAMTADDRNRAYLELLDHLVSGRIALELQRFPLDAVAEAWQRQGAGPGGKVVVDLT
jgi:NADPH:quinone reductase-like Zn-dependent oxidoreductase